MVAWTVGFGQERCNVPINYTGYHFWATEPFQRPDCGISLGNPQIVISGSGDGSLQDFLVHPELACANSTLTQVVVQ